MVAEIGGGGDARATGVAPLVDLAVDLEPAIGDVGRELPEAHGAGARHHPG
jgi:hypothetical protein